MAAPISPVSIGAPAELVAPQPAAVNNVHSSNQGQQGTPFKQHLNNASDKHQSAKDQKNEVAQQRSDKAQLASNRSEQVSSTKSANSLNAADTNAEKASQVSVATKQARPINAEKNSNRVVSDKDVQSTDQLANDTSQVSNVDGSLTGKDLPQTGKELPQPLQDGKLPSEIASVESLNTSLLNIPTQIGEQTAQTLQTEFAPKVDQTLLDASRALNSGQAAQGLENNSLIKTEQSVSPAQSIPNPNLALNASTAPAQGTSSTTAQEEGDRPLVQPLLNTGATSLQANPTSSPLERVPSTDVQQTLVDSKSVETSQGVAQSTAKDTNALSTEQIKPALASKEQSSVLNQGQITGQADNKVATQQPSASNVDSAQLAQSSKGAAQTTSVIQPDKMVNKGAQISANDQLTADSVKLSESSQNIASVNTAQASTKVDGPQVTPVQSIVNTSESITATVNNLNAAVSQGIAESAATRQNQINSTAAQNPVPESMEVAGRTSAGTIKDNLLANAVKTSVEQAVQTDKGPILPVSTGAMAPAPQSSQSGQINVAESATPILDKSLALNQSLEKMRAGIESTAIKDDSADTSQAKHASTKVLASTEGLQQLASMQNGLRSTAPVQMQMPPGTPPEAKNWGKAVADKVYIAASQNLRVANIQLDPPELGALQVRLQVTGPDQQMSVSFTSPHASVRDTLEQQLPRLREMLEEQGINLGESSVNDQRDGSGQMAGEGDSQNSGGYGEDNDPDSPSNPLNTQGTLALVDFYA